MKKEKVKQFMKEHGLQILTGVAGGLLFIGGVAVGKKIMNDKLTTGLDENDIKGFIYRCNGIGCSGNYYSGTYEQGKYTLGNLGEIGKAAIKEAVDAGMTDITDDTGVVGVFISI